MRFSVNSIRLGTWTFSLLFADRLSGLERVALEIHASFTKLLNSEDLFVGILPKGIRIPAERPFFEEIRNDKLLQSNYAQLSDINVLWLSSLNPQGFFEILEERKRGLKVVSFIPDLFPLKYPEYFQKDFLNSFKIWLLFTLKISDVLVFISNEQLNDFKMRKFNFEGRIELIELGASIAGPVFPSRTRNSFALLAVSTIEPRKGFQDVLDAFDILNALGYPVTLDIVGRYGWNQEDLKERILNHRELGKTLIWHSDCSDQKLTEIYRRTSISIMASYNEGWGLALEEGLRHGHKIIARDIPIFRQRENTNVFFFNEENPLVEQIAKALEEPFRPLISRRTMQNFTEELLKVIRDL
jgi:glycosyltransferase involved in cell wall biosynthesis